MEGRLPEINGSFVVPMMDFDTENLQLPNNNSSQDNSGAFHAIPDSSPLNEQVKKESQKYTNASIRSNDDLAPLSWLQSLDMCGVVPHITTQPTPPASPSDRESPPKPIDYSVDDSVKPPYSYAALIGMAMKENDNKMTLSAIYSWIREHFAFYKTADQSWQVRANTNTKGI